MFIDRAALDAKHFKRAPDVAQISNLLCRRLPVGSRWNFEALRIRNPRYGRLGNLRYGLRGRSRSRPASDSATGELCTLKTQVKTYDAAG
jgi:hypothetical protein